jgi:4-amino-4-deoxy-L-arabinose transferase-like glycosyltransferase
VVLLGTAPPTALRTALLLLAVLGTMLAKEVVGVALPATLFLALLWDARRGATVRQSTPWLALLLIGLLLVLALESYSVINAVRDARTGAYATQFEPEFDRLGRSPRLLLAILLPVQYIQSGASGLLYPANVAYLLLLALGGAVWWRQSPPAARPGGAVLVLLLLSVPVIGALTYTFWPRYSAFYGIPFAMGSAGLLTAALSALERARAPIRRLSWSAAALLLMFASLASARTVGDRRAFANLALVTVRQLGQLPTVDSVLVVKAGPGRNRWPVTGPELERYAQAMGEATTHIPVIRDASCEVVAGRLGEPLAQMAILNDQNACGPLPSASHRFRAPADFFDWLALQVRPDTLLIELLAAPPTIP